jgi:hypothetical protein
VPLVPLEAEQVRNCSESEGWGGCGSSGGAVTAAMSGSEVAEALRRGVAESAKGESDWERARESFAYNGVVVRETDLSRSRVQAQR